MSTAMNGNASAWKAGASAKALDTTRANSQAASSADPSAKRNPAPGAWTTGTNPITQRSSASPATNGTANGVSKSSDNSTKRSHNTPATTSAEKHAHDRLLFLLANFTGLPATVTLKNGEQFSGIFSGASTTPTDGRYILKMVKRVGAPAGHQTNGAVELSDEYIGEGEDHVLAIDMQDTVDLEVRNVDLEGSQIKAASGAASSFRTDVEISGNLNMQERQLQRWDAGPASEVNMSLDAGGLGEWDQFAANERLYNVQTDYREEDYTTVIDRSDPNFKRREAEAAKKAREIEKEGAERKRNADADAGLDEEDKYSGVRRDASSLGKRGPNAYVPPSKRPLSAQPVPSGPPDDPAIISSQLARPSPAIQNESGGKPTVTPASAEPAKASLDLVSSLTVSESITKSSAEASDLPAPASLGDVTDDPKDAASTPQQSDKPVTTDSTDNVAQTVLQKFKNFASHEKLKVQQHQRTVQQQRLTNARQEKSVRLNDLKKFSQNFKLYSRVPADLVPILAKSKEKQDEITVKAEQQALEKEQREMDKPVVSPAPSRTDSMASLDPKSLQATPILRDESRIETGSPLGNRQRAVPSARGGAQNVAAQLPREPGMPGQRLPPTQPLAPAQSQQHAQPRAGGSFTLPTQDARNRQAVAIPPVAPGLTSPASPLKFNANAMEFVFKPNPAASTFTPTGPSAAGPAASKRPSVVSPSIAAPTEVRKGAAFFPSGKKVQPIEDRAALAGAFNPIKRMLAAVEPEKKSFFAANGGIPHAYSTPPVWDVSEVNRDVSYADMFPKIQVNPVMSPVHAGGNVGMAHQHQLPLHMQSAAPHMQGPTAQQTPRFYANQPHHMVNQHVDEQRMQYASPNASVQPSPRMGHPPMAFNGQMHPQMQAFPYGMPPAAMSPAMQMGRLPAGGQYMGAQGHQMGGHMMQQQPSNGPFMNGSMAPQMSMYPSPAQSHVQPHFGGHQLQQQTSGGYNGNNRGHPMSHQGSQQGHSSQPMYMMQGPSGPMMMPQQPQHGGQMTPMRNFAQPQFPGAHGQHSYPMQHRAMSNNGPNNQITPRQTHASPQAGYSPSGMPAMHPAAGDEGK